MFNFLSNRYNEGDTKTRELFNNFISDEVLQITTPIQDIPKNADQIYLKINDLYYDLMDICVSIEVLEIRNEIAEIKKRKLT